MVRLETCPDWCAGHAATGGLDAASLPHGTEPVPVADAPLVYGCAPSVAISAGVIPPRDGFHVWITRAYEDRVSFSVRFDAEQARELADATDGIAPGLAEAIRDALARVTTEVPR